MKFKREIVHQNTTRADINIDNVHFEILRKWKIRDFAVQRFCKKNENVTTPCDSMSVI